MKTNVPCLMLLACLLSEATYAEEVHEIAITIDDLPFVGSNGNDPGNVRRTKERFMRILDSLVQAQVPATGFIIAGAISQSSWELLEAFRKEGFGLGNHTYSHPSLNHLTASQYINEIAHADKVLQPVMTQPKYFRYPYLAEGNGAKKQEVQDFLVSNQYIIAPVTIDSKDYKYNERLLNISWRVRQQYVEQIKKQYLAYIWKETEKAVKHAKENSKQILLIHANLLNSYCLGDIIRMYKDHGYRFVSLSEALTNTAPTLNETKDEKKENTVDPSKAPTQSTSNDIEDKSDIHQNISQNYTSSAWLSEWDKGW